MAILGSMGFTESLQRVRTEVEGDAFFRLLRSQLAGGHTVQSVSFLPAEERQPARYRFLLARLGGLSTVEVPAGGLAVERLLAERGQKLASVEDEVGRSALLLRRAVEGLARVLGEEAAQEVLAGVVRDFSGPESSRAVAARPQRMNVTVATRLAAGQLRHELEAQVRELYAERGYTLEEAGRIVDQALTRLLRAG